MNAMEWSGARTENTVTRISWHMQRGFFVPITVHRLFLTNSTATHHCIDRNIYYVFQPRSAFAFLLIWSQPHSESIDENLCYFIFIVYDLFFNSNINLFISKNIHTSRRVRCWWGLFLVFVFVFVYKGMMICNDL